LEKIVHEITTEKEGVFSLYAGGGCKVPMGSQLKNEGEELIPLLRLVLLYQGKIYQEGGGC